MSDFNFDDAIRSADREVQRLKDRHEAAMEFWKGYAAAMREVQRYMEEKP